MECLSSDAGDSHLNQDYYLGSISEFEGSFSYRGSSSSLALMILSSVRLITFVYLFACGCPRDEN